MCDTGRRLTFITPVACRQAKTLSQKSSKVLELGTPVIEAELTVFGGVT